MTRINVIPPSELTRQHLVAEYKEIARIFNLVRKAIARGERPNLEGEYKLGTGHVRFFYARLGWIVKRQAELIDEMLRRGYRAAYEPMSLDTFPKAWCNDWIVTDEAMMINRQRIRERLDGQNK